MILRGMTSPGATRGPRSNAAVTLTMSFDEADFVAATLEIAADRWLKHAEDNHSAQVEALFLRVLNNKVTQIREQLPEGYGPGSNGAGSH